MSIYVLTTGGTISALPYEDPTHVPEYVTMPPDQRDYAREVLETFTFAQTRYHPLKPIDSKHMDKTYRQNMLQLIEEAPEKAILISHGTDTILETADYFYQPMQSGKALKNKIVLITGSMMPLANGPASDGYLNLEFSVRQLLELSKEPIKSSVYIVLSDYDFPDTASGDWKPRLYHYQPGRYKKIFTNDGRYNRLIRV